MRQYLISLKRRLFSRLFKSTLTKIKGKRLPVLKCSENKILVRKSNEYKKGGKISHHTYYIRFSNFIGILRIKKLSGFFILSCL